MLKPHARKIWQITIPTNLLLNAKGSKLNQTCLRDTVAWNTKIMTFCPRTSGNREFKTLSLTVKALLTLKLPQKPVSTVPGARLGAKAWLKLPTTRNGFLSTSAYRSSSLQGSAGKPAHARILLRFFWLDITSLFHYLKGFERHSSHKFYSASISSLLFYLTPSFRSSTSLGMVLPPVPEAPRERGRKCWSRWGSNCNVPQVTQPVNGRVRSERQTPRTPGPRSCSRTTPCSLPYTPCHKKYPRAL